MAVALDLIFLPLTFYLCVLLRYDSSTPQLFQMYFWIILAAPLISIPIFIRLGLYRAVIRFIDQKIVYVVVLGVTLSVVCMAALATFTHTVHLSRGVFGIYWVSAILYVVASRFIARGYLLKVDHGGGNAVRVAIYGAGHAGMQLASALRAGHEYLPVAMVDDRRELHGATIAGVRVWPAKELPRLVKEKQIREILLAMPSLRKIQQRAILESLEPLKVKIKVTPPIASLVNGELRVQDIRDIEIEDLLGRDAVAPDPQLLSTCIENKVVMVTGAGGSIGSELCRQIVLLSPSRLILLDMSEYALYQIEQELQGILKSKNLPIEVLPFLGSVLDGAKCEQILRTFAVDTIYHAAAYKHVPLVEHNPIQGVRNNALGTKVLAQAAVDAGVSCFVLISTDKAVRPTNVMGATKRLAELILQAFARTQQTTRFCMVRFGNVLGSSGSVVPLFRKQIMAGGPVTVTHPEITRYFMTIPEAAQLVLQAGSMGEGGDVFVLDMGEPVKILDLARRMVHLSGLEVRGESDAPDAIEIEHVGLRPGEKLYEELLIGANVEGTQHALIMRAQETELPWDALKTILVRLEDACERFDYQEIRALLQHAVEEYAPQCEIEDLLWRENRDAGMYQKKQENGREDQARSHLKQVI
ncbi:nucleoside-diphosphate sugar epimerase [Oxalicibacterium solurbis]|uniref:Nucleoside-diphosphate sugar epimerase n=2 Tax=Oxalicibacterium solurbis TaxID=69280 RepID=A0A8J3AVN3_9BURK|nr:nucleoside-diphosphate sugar epimerase [Oxalicibacterium solurbis]